MLADRQGGVADELKDSETDTVKVPVEEREPVSDMDRD